MAGRIQIKLIILIFLSLTSYSGALEPSDILVSYSFDDSNIATGPDTFAVFEKAKGTVNLTTRYRYSGYRSVEIRDVAGDGDFPELQGYFKLRDGGMLYAHFAILTTDSHDLMNIALAGPMGFRLKKDGISFWLQTKNGYLYHVSDSMPKKLFPIKEFTWYLVDVAYDIDEGTYDLEIYEEGIEEAVVNLKDQPNSPNQPGSSVDKFSFITDPGLDTSNLTYYVDDVVIGLDEDIMQLPYVAPGRRKLFIDMWNEQQAALREKPICLPATELSDFGVSAMDVEAMMEENSLQYLRKLLSGGTLPENLNRKVSGSTYKVLRAVDLWKKGCEALLKGEGNTALENFEKALYFNRDGKIFELSRAIALSAMGMDLEAERELYRLGDYFQDDLRHALALAMVAIKKGDMENAKIPLLRKAPFIPDVFSDEIPDSFFKRLWSGELNRDLYGVLFFYMPDDWVGYKEDALIAEQYFYTLLWNGDFQDAETYAFLMSSRMEELDAPRSKWVERAGDAVFFDGDCGRALSYYKESALMDKNSSSVLGKLSDAAYCLGDLDGERKYREKIYGALEYD